MTAFDSAVFICRNWAKRWQAVPGKSAPAGCAGTSGASVPGFFTRSLTKNEAYLGLPCVFISFVDSAQEGFDGYIHLYKTSFDSLNQLINLLAGNDDFGSISASQIASQALMADTQYFLITNAFFNGQVGTFTNTIRADQGDPSIQLGLVGDAPVPAPATLAIMGLGLAGLGRQRRQKEGVSKQVSSKTLSGGFFIA